MLFRSAQIRDATVASSVLAVVEPIGTDQIIALVVDQSVLKATGDHLDRHPTTAP